MAIIDGTALFSSASMSDYDIQLLLAGISDFMNDSTRYKLESINDNLEICALSIIGIALKSLLALIDLIRHEELHHCCRHVKPRHYSSS